MEETTTVETPAQEVASEATEELETPTTPEA